MEQTGLGDVYNCIHIFTLRWLLHCYYGPETTEDCGSEHEPVLHIKQSYTEQ